MSNDLLPSSPVALGVLYGAMLLYLAAGAAACQFPLRSALDAALLGPGARHTTARAVRRLCLGHQATTALDALTTDARLLAFLLPLCLCCLRLAATVPLMTYCRHLTNTHAWQCPGMQTFKSTIPPIPPIGCD